MTDLGFRRHVEALGNGHFVRLVNYHWTSPRGADALRAELRSLSRRYQSVGLRDLDTFSDTGRWPLERPGFIPVFYEGYRNSAEVAAPICEEFGITGWFPVCTGFIDTPVEEQEYFARSHYIGLQDDELDDGRIAMSWDDVARLSERHVVLPHTASHVGIIDVSTDEDLQREVLEPKRRMDAVTGQSAPAFAWLWGSPYGVSEKHDRAVLDAGYRYQISNTMIQRLV